MVLVGDVYVVLIIFKISQYVCACEFVFTVTVSVVNSGVSGRSQFAAAAAVSLGESVVIFALFACEYLHLFHSGGRLSY